MLWTEIRSWAKKIGYETKKIEDQFSWKKIGSEETGVCKNLNELATEIFNKHTDYKWFEHQQNYKKNKGI